MNKKDNILYGRKDILEKVGEYRELYRRMESLGIQAPQEIVSYLEALEVGDFDDPLSGAVENVTDGFTMVQRIDLKKINPEIRYIYVETPVQE